MNSSEKLFASRVLLGALSISFMLIAYVTYSEYYTEIENKISQKVTNSLRHLDNSVAKL
ncbi:hypothetical protein [Costertonia aggregata]|uniref:Uncharacterized protein n=1 Tax=Costertonia aggregata TaxID=343403 RepID=A0A7H9APR6_9FLAO|nr:hypothetical protein [Costertonia aggregata]QLG45420.1 hypothetical protein HYG79_08690 [Costertonia aggregata]